MTDAETVRLVFPAAAWYRLMSRRDRPTDSSHEKMVFVFSTIVTCALLDGDSRQAGLAREGALTMKVPASWRCHDVE